MKWRTWWYGRSKVQQTQSDEAHSGVALGPRIDADNPVSSPEQDALGRNERARIFAEQILALDSSEGIVVGVLGPWGSGKTSFVNLARLRLAELGIPTLEFNPWMFSGAEQLVESFFVELSAQLKMRPGFAHVGELFEQYGESFSGLSWLPLVGPWIERGRSASKALAQLLKRKKEGIGERRSKIRSELAKIEKPIVVVLDDIDRLTTTEIRDVFKLVRLTANFPNIVYLLAFDRQRVEEALSEQGIPGRSYLEKILQVGADLPAVPHDVLNSQIFRAIDASLASIDVHGRFDEKVWPDVFMEVIHPLIRNMRDVRRYAATIYGTVKDLGTNVALVDALALEAIRTFLPDVFHRMYHLVSVLTGTSRDGAARDDFQERKEKVDSLIASSDGHDEVVRNLIRRLFPAAQRFVGGSTYGADWQQRWLRDRRVAHESILRFYFERVMGQTLAAFTRAESAWPLMTDQEGFNSYLRSLNFDGLEDVISSLESYEDQFGADQVVPAATVLLNLLPDLPVRERGFFSFDTRMVVMRVVYRLVRALRVSDAIERAVGQILPKVTTLGSKRELILCVGHQDGIGHKLIDETAAKALEKVWRSEVRAADEDQLLRERELFWLLSQTRRESPPEEGALRVPNSPQFTLAILRSARTDVRSQAIGNRAVKYSPRLPWESLVQLFGDEATLRERVEALRAAALDNSTESLDLIDRYLAGYRPRDRDLDDD